jgi:anti-sigma factor RsiW
MANEIMQCGAARELMPLYLSGELEGSLRPGLDAHLDHCAACRALVDAEQQVDAELRNSLLAEEVAIGPILNRFRNEAISKRLGLRAKLAMAAGLVATIAAGFTYWQVAGEVPKVYAAALRDHHRELVEKQPRRWVSELAAVELLATEQGVAAQLLGRLMPAGYRLERGKMCRLNGRAFLHLVYEHEGGQVSLFLRREADEQGKRYSSEAGGDHLAGVQAGGLSVVYVTDGADEAQRLAAQAAEVL